MFTAQPESRGIGIIRAQTPGVPGIPLKHGCLQSKRLGRNAPDPEFQALDLNLREERVLLRREQMRRKHASRVGAPRDPPGSVAEPLSTAYASPASFWKMISVLRVPRISRALRDRPSAMNLIVHASSSLLGKICPIGLAWIPPVSACVTSQQ